MKSYLVTFDFADYKYSYAMHGFISLSDLIIK